MTAPRFDVAVVGAGAAGLFCAALAGQRGLKVLVIDHAAKVAEKIRISGGGRCNFTNRGTTPAQFLSENPAFCRSALARYTPADFIDLLARHRIGWHEKHKGQLFCDDGSEAVIRMLLAECDGGGVTRWQPCAVHEVTHGAAGFTLATDRGNVSAARLVVATGGLSIPKIGASDFGLKLARRFGHRIVEPRPALVPLTFDAAAWAPFAALAGVALPVEIAAGGGGGSGSGSGGGGGGSHRVKGRAGAAVSFHEDLLFTHRGLSGPAVLQISSYWRPGEALRIDLSPGVPIGDALVAAKADAPRRRLGTELAARLPARLAAVWLAGGDDDARDGGLAQRPLADLRDRDLRGLGEQMSGWTLVPTGSEGWRKAEVMAGGVDTRELGSQTLESRLQPGLHFIGEVVDVTGWLGGYNFQWAWASAAACARGIDVPAGGG